MCTPTESSAWGMAPPVVSRAPPLQLRPYNPLPARPPGSSGPGNSGPPGEARPGSVVAGGNRIGPNWTTAVTNSPSTENLHSVNPVAGQAVVQEPAAAAAADPAVVLPATEVQAVEILHATTATRAEKDAATAIVSAKIRRCEALWRRPERHRQKTEICDPVTSSSVPAGTSGSPSIAECHAGPCVNSRPGRVSSTKSRTVRPEPRPRRPRPGTFRGRC